jgi:hypothetical protein
VELREEFGDREVEVDRQHSEGGGVGVLAQVVTEVVHRGARDAAPGAHLLQ